VKGKGPLEIREMEKKRAAGKEERIKKWVISNQLAKVR
jgi:hypothetical protein